MNTADCPQEVHCSVIKRLCAGAVAAPDVQRAHAELAGRQRRRLWGAVQAALDAEAASTGTSGQAGQDIGRLIAPSDDGGSALRPLLLRLYLQSVDGASLLRSFP